jgi:hypothetical protein
MPARYYELVQANRDCRTLLLTWAIHMCTTILFILFPHVLVTLLTIMIDGWMALYIGKNNLRLYDIWLAAAAFSVFLSVYLISDTPDDCCLVPLDSRRFYITWGAYMIMDMLILVRAFQIGLYIPEIWKY